MPADWHRVNVALVNAYGALRELIRKMKRTTNGSSGKQETRCIHSAATALKLLCDLWKITSVERVWPARPVRRMFGPLGMACVHAIWSDYIADSSKGSPFCPGMAADSAALPCYCTML